MSHRFLAAADLRTESTQVRKWRQQIYTFCLALNIYNGSLTLAYLYGRIDTMVHACGVVCFLAAKSVHSFAPLERNLP